jgi:hypothetical protein
VTVDGHISQEDLALYALRILSEGESAAVRAHLAECVLCRDELAEFSGAAAMVGLAIPQHPVPVGARQRFLNKIAADTSTTKQPEKQAMRGQASLLLRNTWIPWATAATLAIIAISLGVKNNALNKELGDVTSQVMNLTNQSARARQVLDVLSSHSAQRVLLTAGKTSVEPTGRAVYLADSGSLVFQANNLKLLATDKTYELWVIPVSGKPIPAGLFRPDAAGSASVFLPPLPKGVAAKAFGVTIEKAQGSDSPTAPIILSGATSSTAGE